MSINRHGKERDSNEKEIVDALVAAGASVARIGQEGVPDLLVGWQGETHLLEVKRPVGPKGGTKDRTLKPSQVKWWAAWNGRPPVIVRTVAEALEAIGAVARPL